MSDDRGRLVPERAVLALRMRSERPEQGSGELMKPPIEFEVRPSGVRRLGLSSMLLLEPDTGQLSRGRQPGMR